MAIRPHFNVDLRALKRQYLQMQQQCHPDQFIAQQQQQQQAIENNNTNEADGDNENLERQWAEQQSALLNRAYQTLKDPLSRSIYMVCFYFHVFFKFIA